MTRTNRYAASDMVWCAALVVLTLSPLLGDVAARAVLLVAALGLLAGVVVTVLRAVVPTRFMPPMFVLPLIIGGAVAGTNHRTLALSWVGALVFGVLVTAMVLERRRGVANNSVRRMNGDNMKPETLLIGVYPRDDVTWPKDGRVRRGLIEVIAGDGRVVASQQMGEFFPPLSPDLLVGDGFVVRVTASDGGQGYAGDFSFVVTGEESDVDHYTVGPGVEVERGRWGRKNVTGFEFGATVMGAQPR